ncbi:hypothetical protein [Lignipirellula cremea]|uniref:Uncharacterized protein n=1 Tax=Lignipirellula cremea TaxID=2528010 RepID=A0A518DZL8_9BACT|nr:hypothetical protein [Lignipirellula cremea]QDU97288.1 hypothetical protein Pla8534_51340 [Lignipirellula cremea]
MIEDDDAELRRLCEQLQQISRMELTELQEEALMKAAYALHFAFLDRRRGEIEEFYGMTDAELTNAQRQHLRSLGIDPDAPVEDDNAAD